MDGGGLMRAILSLSGGMDSTSLLINLLSNGYEVSCISFDYGQKHKLELIKAKNNIVFLRENGHKIDHKIIDLTSVMSLLSSALTDPKINIPEGHYEEDQMKLTVVPNRNAIFSSILYGYAISLSNLHNTDVQIALGVHSGDHTIYPDCRPEFYESINNSFSLGNWDSEKVSFYLPFIEGNKKYILEDALKSCQILGISFDTIFANTITSYNPDSKGRSSGKSGSDVERILAFHSIGRIDPIEYVKPWEEILKNALEIELRHHVTRNNGTERGFTGKYDDHFDEGEYRCYNCNILLFTSDMKYNSNCGWPAFHSEHSDAKIKKVIDTSHGMKRVEVRCSQCDSHLGHIFDDGPNEYGNNRYCINSISLDFKENK